MPDVILKLLSALGILLLVLLGVTLFLLLLVLFYPVTYKAKGVKNNDGTELSVNAAWLFGVLRIRYDYPEPGVLTVKLLWHTLFGARSPKAEKQKGRSKDKSKSRDKSRDKDKKIKVKAEDQAESVAGKAPALEPAPGNAPEEAETAREGASEEKRAEGNNSFEKKFAEIKYTILNICGKIKELWENVEFYSRLLRDEETKQLISIVFFRLGRLLKHSRPGKLEVEALFGTGSPDTTGYAYGAYAMFMPVIGPGVIVTPDFERRILEGHFYMSGHIFSAVLIYHVLKVLMDDSFKKVFKKLKAGRK